MLRKEIPGPHPYDKLHCCDFRNIPKIVKISNFWYKFALKGRFSLREFYKIQYGGGSGTGMEQSAGMEQSSTRDSRLLLTFDIPKEDQVSPFSSVILMT